MRKVPASNGSPLQAGPLSVQLHLGLNLKSLLVLVPHQSGAAEGTPTERLVRAIRKASTSDQDMMLVLEDA